MRAARNLLVSGLLTVAPWVASAGCDALVGGECQPGLVATKGACLTPAGVGGAGGKGGEGGEGGTDGGASAGGEGGTAGSNRTGGAGGEGCTPPLVPCPDGCVDLQTDPRNCGFCENACATEICEQGLCAGQPAGHLIVAAMSFAQFNAPGQRLLGNALYLPPDDPVRILVYRKFANAGAAGNVDAILAAEGALRGRSFIVKTRDTAAALGSDLSGGTYDVLLIHDQPSAPNGQMQSLGSALQGAISSFAQAGGTVVVLASATGEMSAFLTSSGILATTALTDATGAAILGVVPNDVVAVGVLSPFLAKPATATIGSSEPSGPLLTHVFVHKASMAPIVIHKIVLK